MIEVTRGDLTRMDVDAVVNAAAPHLLGGGGVDGAIHRAAGPRLLEACREIGGCAHGDAVVTPGFDLPARWVIHAVGPIWRGGGHGEDATLASAHRRAIALARELELTSIAFPAISCGAYGFPVERAARIAVGTAREAARETALERIVFVCFGDDTLGPFAAALEERA